MKKLDSLIAEDLLSKINPSVQPTRLSAAISNCTWGSRQAEQAIIRGLELLAKEKPKEELLFEIS
jgi:hypothetical protein